MKIKEKNLLKNIRKFCKNYFAKILQGGVKSEIFMFFKIIFPCFKKELIKGLWKYLNNRRKKLLCKCFIYDYYNFFACNYCKYIDLAN